MLNVTATQEMGGIRLALFERWLASAEPGESFVYFRGESIAAAKENDPTLQVLADQMLRHADYRGDIISTCGHIRGEIIGSGEVELVTRRDRGELVYIARKRKAPE